LWLVAEVSVYVSLLQVSFTLDIDQSRVSILR
jgi:hypothetical protein